jgi:anaerobic selenocysteine-containing dehydrogenase
LRAGCLTFTNTDRTVHLSEKAVDPPGEARPDLDIFIDYAHRLGLSDKDGRPLVTWSDAEGAFEAWKRCTAGRPCDYTGLSYAKLRGGSGIQWPCNTEHPEGTERLYEGGRFWSHPSECETYGRDLLTGAPLSPDEYKAMNPDGKAVLKAAEYLPPHEESSSDYPFVLTTGRTLFHFHTRTKTGRARQLQDAAPDMWIEVSAYDAERHGWDEGDLLEVATPRGKVQAKARVSGIRRGVVFLPFHYGYWDTPAWSSPGDGPGRAANELTLTDWDAASKQPIFKTAAARVVLVSKGETPASAPTNTGSRPVTAHVEETRGGRAAEVTERHLDRTRPGGGP